MVRGWYYAKLSLSNPFRLPFSGICILLFLFLSLCRFCLFVFFFCSHWSLVDVPLISFCLADHVPDWQPRILLGMVEARSVNVKKPTTTAASPTANVFCDCDGVRLGCSQYSEQVRTAWAELIEALCSPCQPDDGALWTQKTCIYLKCGSGFLSVIVADACTVNLLWK